VNQGADVPSFARFLLLVLDSVGIGALPDSERYGDQGSNTIGNITTRVRAGADLGARATFAGLEKTIAHNCDVGPPACGTSFLENIFVEYS